MKAVKPVEEPELDFLARLSKFCPPWLPIRLHCGVMVGIHCNTPDTSPNSFFKSMVPHVFVRLWPLHCHSKPSLIARSHPSLEPSSTQPYTKERPSRTQPYMYSDRVWT